MHWQDRVRQALKQKDIEAALLEFSISQQKKDALAKDPTALSQERKLKRLKAKSKENPDSSAHLTPSSSDAGSDTGNASDHDSELKLT